VPSRVQKAITKDETARIKAILPIEAERRLNPEDKSPVREVFNLEGQVVEPDNLRAWHESVQFRGVVCGLHHCWGLRGQQRTSVGRDPAGPVVYLSPSVSDQLPRRLDRYARWDGHLFAGQKDTSPT
jgi:hypothetical protein